MTVFILSAASGVNKGVKFLSQLNIVIAVALMLFYPRFWPHRFFAGFLLSWASYVGLFIAGISRGRTIREFVGTVLIIPTVFTFLWMTVFGNSAIWLDQTIAAGKVADSYNSTMLSDCTWIVIRHL
jgi:choline/glycine/proline betaine transport protein